MYKALCFIFMCALDNTCQTTLWSTNKQAVCEFPSILVQIGVAYNILVEQSSTQWDFIWENILYSYQ